MAKRNNPELVKARKFAALMTDLAEVMQKHGITDMLAYYELDGEFRNTYLPLHPDGEKQLFCFLSDATNAWLLQHGYSKSPKAIRSTQIKTPKTIKDEKLDTGNRREYSET